MHTDAFLQRLKVSYGGHRGPFLFTALFLALFLLASTTAQDQLAWDVATSTNCEDIRHANDQCHFAKQYCEDEGIIPYLRVYYCTLSPVQAVAWISISAWTITLFLSIGICAGDFFSPNLSFIAESLHLSDTLAGVTLLAIGNGAPDIFSTWAAVRSKNVDLALGEVLGAASFITTVIAGSLALVRPFEVLSASLTRDAGFLFVTAIILLLPLTQGTFVLWHAILMITTYAVYIACVLIQHWRTNKQMALPAHAPSQNPSRDVSRRTPAETAPLLGPRSSSSHHDSHQPLQHTCPGRTSPTTHRDLDTWRRIQHRCVEGHDKYDYVLQPSLAAIWDNHRHHKTSRKDRSLSVAGEDGTQGQHADDVAPEAASESCTMHVMHRVLPSLRHISFKAPLHALYSVFSAIPHCIFTITIPVVTNQHCDVCQNGWDRWLLLVQVFFAPQLVWASQWLSHHEITAVQSWLLPAGYCLVGSVVLDGLIVLVTTSAKRPLWLPLTGIAGFVLSAYWLSLIANEVVAIMKAVGGVLHISQALLGFSLLAVGNSMDDYFADMMIASHGHPAMSFAACFGGPLLNVLLGLGSSLTYTFAQRRASGEGPSQIQITATPALILSTGVLAATMAMIVTILYMRSWHLDRVIGCGLVSIWVILTITNIVVEAW